ncbi:MAG: iron ABC transporter permease [Deltaproteobacteria bacterium]|jgi:iron complex transport system permease protein|nr:iron ABC transporter permease [Deltaproteobacteria bacterium]
MIELTKNQSSPVTSLLAFVKKRLATARDFFRRHEWAMPLLLAISLAGTVVGSLLIGAYPMSFWRAGEITVNLGLPWALPSESSWSLMELAVIQMIRLPRVLLATLVGMALGMSGAALQGMMRNPLVGPDLVGVSSGAALGGVFAIMFYWSESATVALAFLGGLLALGGTYGLAHLARSFEGIGLILSGIFVGAFCISGVCFGLFLADDHQMSRIGHLVMGYLNEATPQTVWLLTVPTLVGGSILMLLRWRINLLSLGNADALSLGINVRLLRLTIIAVVSLIVAAQVSVSGLIGWVGLVVPHCARMLVGPDHRKLLPASALLGGMFVLLIDDFTRVVLRTDVGTGTLTTLIGTPFICFLFWKKKTKGWIND